MCYLTVIESQVPVIVRVFRYLMLEEGWGKTKLNADCKGRNLRSRIPFRRRMIILSNRMSVHSPLPSVIHIGDADVPFVSSVKNNGVTLDTNLSMSQVT